MDMSNRYAADAMIHWTRMKRDSSPDWSYNNIVNSPTYIFVDAMQKCSDPRQRWQFLTSNNDRRDRKIRLWAPYPHTCWPAAVDAYRVRVSVKRPRHSELDPIIWNPCTNVCKCCSFIFFFRIRIFIA